MIMRLFVLALTVPVFAQPALAREHGRHHHGSHAARSHHLMVHARYGWQTADRSRYRETRAAADERSGGFAERTETRAFAPRGGGRGELDAMIARHAQMNGLPEALVHRVVIRESRYNARVVGRGGAMGLMQIKYSTARAMGYSGSPAGLLDPETNLTYAVRYLAGAYRVAGGNSNRAVSNYARGYYDAAKRQGVSPYAAQSSAGWSHAQASPGTYAQVSDADASGRLQYAVRRSRRWQ